ncbi:hypothetical protein [Halalkalibacter urbisdiaboli]|uniref:hypothetical protein n=1 Tax=Halalkalibacter urbisdiaboli TaxID=1960589 RepID=UPI000B431281|nr:hypothetical protein [Halalkalibacter urbisdiaboli]
MVIHFELKNKEEVLKLNKIATSYSFDIWVHSENQMFDAKTLLALYTLPFNKELRLVVEEGVESKALLKDMESFRTK